MKNYIYVGIVALLVGLVIGYTFIHESPGVKGISPNGTVQLQDRALQTNVSFLTSTSTSITNNSGYDENVINVYAVCSSVGSSFTAYTGAALTNWLLTIATSSVGQPLVNSYNTNYIVNAAAVGTSTGWANYSSTTPNAISANPVNLVVPAGANLTFSFNATNTANCTVGAGTIGL